MSLVLDVAKALGAVGVRFLQVLGQYYSVSPDVQQEFQNVYDDVSLLYKANVFQTTRKAIETFEEEIKGLEGNNGSEAEIEELRRQVEAMKQYLASMRVIDKIGGGSIVTVYRTTIKAGGDWFSADPADWDVYKITSPRILDRLKQDLKMVSNIVDEMLKIDFRHPDVAEWRPGKRAEYRMAKRLIGTLGEWINDDVRDPDYLALDELYSKTHEDYQAPNGVKIEVSQTKLPYNRYVKTEKYVEAPTLNKYINELTNNNPNLLKEMKSAEAERAKRAIEAVTYDYVRHLFEPLDLGNGKNKVVTHSDIHAGNVLISTQTDTIDLIDRNYYLVLENGDIKLFKVIFSSKEKGLTKLTALINYFIRESGVQGYQALKTRISMYWSVLKLGKQRSDAGKVMSALLHQASKANLPVPLRFRLFLKNYQAINKLLFYAGDKTFTDFMQERLEQENDLKVEQEPLDDDLTSFVRWGQGQALAYAYLT
jgi:hypothetical protein